MKGLFIQIAILVSLTAHGTKVTEQQALQKAQQFMPGKQFATTNMRRANMTGLPNGDQPYYIFNAKQQGGFVIVSSDDRTEAILGYSTQGTFDPDNMPDNLRWWLEEYASQLKTIDSHQMTPAPRRAAVDTKPAIKPLIKTQWGQGGPYHSMTPTSNSSNGSYHYSTGCVATALAQVMNYWQWPKDCPAIPAYTTLTQHLQFDELPATTFKWDLMKEKYDYSESSDSALAVAELMRYVGQAMNMDYGSEGGSASHIAVSVMINKLGYSCNMKPVYRNDFTATEWDNLIYQELAASRPVLYSGNSEKGGHQFICDGYDGNGLYHINWGWDGSCDGYFVLSLSNPYEEGIGADEGRGYYDSSQEAHIGTQPATADETEIPSFRMSTGKLSDATYSRLSSDSDFKSVSTKGSWLHARYFYVPITTYPIELAWAIWKEGEIIKVSDTIKEVVIDNRDTPNTSKTYQGPEAIDFGAGLTDGHYRLMLVWRPQGETDWNTVPVKSAIHAEIAGNTLNVRGSNVSPFYPFAKDATYTVEKVTFSGEMAEGTQNRVSVILTNTCDEPQPRVFFWMNVNDEWQRLGRAVGSVDPGETGRVNIDFVQEIPGDHDVKITSDANGNNVMWQSTITIIEYLKKALDEVVYYMNPVTKEAKVFGSSTKELSNIVIPSNVEFGDYEYPVTRICRNAFSNCIQLKSVFISEGVKSIEEEAFYCCFKLEELSLPSTLENLAEKAFYRCGLNTIISKMQDPCHITSNVFQKFGNINGKLVDVFSTATLYIPIGAKEAYLQAEGWNQFPEIYEGEPRENAVGDITFRYVTGEDFADIVKADLDALNGKDLVIPSTILINGKNYHVKKIEDNVFYGAKIKSLTIEPGLEEIGTLAFNQCKSLENVVIPEGVKVIDSKAFHYCSNIEKLHLPSTLVYLGEKAFYGCKGIKVIISRMQHPCSITTDVFQYVEYIDNAPEYKFTTASLFVPESSKDVYRQAEGWNQFQSILEGEMREFTINELTYRYATGEDFADVVKTGFDSFKNKDLVIPAFIKDNDKTLRVRKIEEEAFKMVLIKSLTIEPGLEEIGKSAFYLCNLTAVVIPEGVKTINEWAFQNCYYLETVTLPSTLENLSKYAFFNCMRLKTVTNMSKQPFPISPTVFQYSTEVDGKSTYVFTTATLHVPEGTQELYRQAEGWNQFQTIATFGTGICKPTLSDEQSIQRIYSPCGDQTEHLQKGLNIVIMDDGTTKKVLVR